MSKSNKKARQALERIYGKGCFIERAGIRYISPEEEAVMKKTITGFKKLDRTITYHHLRPKSAGGKATVDNGANIARYNHDWLEQLPPDRKAEVNNKLRQFKISVFSFAVTKEGMEIGSFGEVRVPRQSEEEEYLIIPAYDTSIEQYEELQKEKRQKFNRSKVKREWKKQLNEELEWEDYEL